MAAWAWRTGSKHQANPELKGALSSCKLAFWGVALTSGILSILYLTGSFYMLEVYDRVVPSRSVPTLVGLSLLALILYTFQGLLDLIRNRVLIRIGAALDARLGRRAFDVTLRIPLKAGGGTSGLQPLRDLDHVRGFLSSLGLAALFDLPWMPIYLAICFAFHVMIGLTGLVGAILLIALTIINDRRTRGPMKKVTEIAAARGAFIEAGKRNAEVIHAMGMSEFLADKWAETNDSYLQVQREMSDGSGGISTLTKVLRMAIQSAALGVGGLLVIEQQATGGIIIAGSILIARALAPVELAIAHWRNFTAARQGWQRLGELLERFPVQAHDLELTPPTKRLEVEALTLVPPGSERAVVTDVTFALKAGDGLGIIGPSASGKSSLARAMVGAWTPYRGKVRLDGAALDQWLPTELGPHIGYLPQDVELFDGNVARNIARFEANPSGKAVLEAADIAGCHDMILRLPNGYETQIGEGGAALSAGQRQRIALARALYRNPFLIVLDEPNSNLDAEGDEALNKAVFNVRERGAIVVIVAHRQAALAGVDQVLLLMDGRVQSFGPRDEIMSRVLRPALVKPVRELSGLRAVGEPGGLHR
jgi:PrtD family type I secretion system ABC transporter